MAFTVVASSCDQWGVDHTHPSRRHICRRLVPRQDGHLRLESLRSKCGSAIWNNRPPPCSRFQPTPGTSRRWQPAERGAGACFSRKVATWNSCPRRAHSDGCASSRWRWCWRSWSSRRSIGWRSCWGGRSRRPPPQLLLAVQESRMVTFADWPINGPRTVKHVITQMVNTEAPPVVTLKHGELPARCSPRMDLPWNTIHGAVSRKLCLCTTSSTPRTWQAPSWYSEGNPEVGGEAQTQDCCQRGCRGGIPIIDRMDRERDAEGGHGGERTPEGQGGASPFKEKRGQVRCSKVTGPRSCLSGLLGEWLLWIWSFSFLRACSLCMGEYS